MDQSQREASQISQEDVRKVEIQIRDWQSKAMKSDEELRDKCLIIANQIKVIT